MRQKVRSCISGTKALFSDLVTWGERAASVEMELQLTVGIGVVVVMRRWMSLRLFCWEVGREVKFRVGSCRFWTRGGFDRGDGCSDAVRERSEMWWAKRVDRPLALTPRGRQVVKVGCDREVPLVVTCTWTWTWL